MANFSGGGLIAPTGMNQYAQSFQQGMASGQKNLAKQQYAQKFKEITGVDSTGNEKLDAEIYQKTELRNQQQQFAQNAPPGYQVSSIAGVGSYTRPDSTDPFKMQQFYAKQKETEAKDVMNHAELTRKQIEDWGKYEVSKIEKENLTDDEKNAKIQLVNDQTYERISKVNQNVNNYNLGMYGADNAKSTNFSLAPTGGRLTTPNVATTPTTQSTGGIVTGGTPQTKIPTAQDKVDVANALKKGSNPVKIKDHLIKTGYNPKDFGL